MRGLVLILGLIFAVTALGYLALTGSGSPPSGGLVLVHDEQTTSTSDPEKNSLAYGMKVASHRARQAEVVEVQEPMGPDAVRLAIIAKLEGQANLSEGEREILLTQLWPEVGKSQEINQEIFRATIAALTPLQSAEASPDSAGLRQLVNRSLGLMVAANPDPTLAVQEVANFLERIPNAPVRKVVVDAFSGSYYDGKNIIRRELASRALPVSDDEADTTALVPPSPPSNPY